MESAYPQEYLPLYHHNYASIRDFDEVDCSNAGAYTNGNVTDSHNVSDASFEIEHQMKLELPSDSVTVFKKLRINLNSMQVDIFDGRFSDTWGKQFVPYASARSCSTGTCRLGKFLINLEGTGFAVSRETVWRASRSQAFGHVTRIGDSKIVVGSCGGECGGCWPDPHLKLEPADKPHR
uniref:GON domain-containing protein n=1 Tax=Mesocestoides corti TaxID=53468 RepID=A0A5K3G4E7_MESCO